MHGAKSILILWTILLPLQGADFSGANALDFTRQVVALGPRPPGSAAHKKMQGLIETRVKAWGGEIAADSFVANTPTGRTTMTNLIARYPGASGKVVVFSGHYDTKHMPGIDFVGANDGGSSTGFLLELAHVLATRKNGHEVYVVWFDGEEAFVQYTATDGFYGSRHLARRWEREGVLGRIAALINVDMIGDKDLRILREQYSSAKLNELVWSAAAGLGYQRHFSDGYGAVLDDHVAFVEKGAPAIDLIDFEYGPDNSYWHTPRDTMDKLSAASLEVVGKVLLEVLSRLERGATAAPRSPVPSR